jgi:hypothetical protein
MIAAKWIRLFTDRNPLICNFARREELFSELLCRSEL